MSHLGPSLEDLLPQKPSQPQDEDEPKTRLNKKIDEITLQEKETETEQLAQAQGLAYINLAGFAISPDTLTTISEERARELQTICFLNNGTEIRLGAADYDEKVRALEKELKEKFFANVSTYLISRHSFESAIKLYANLPKLRPAIAGIEIKKEDLKKFEGEIRNFRDLDAAIQRTSVTELITLLIAGAIKSRASDVHVEAEEKQIKVRYRVDGVLNDAASLKKEIWPKVISRLKQMARLKINVADRPQDGRFSIYLDDGKIDVRVSALPTAYGESVVMRLLMSSTSAFSFEDLGLRGEAFKVLDREISRPNGLIITTGPTGSGKTTTLYAALKKLNKPDTKIITIEDPIEYELKGVNQSQINKEYTFAKGLRSIVRQDPDIIMVGEIRDLETAEIAIQASLTGHLVLSTIHTNDAFGAIPRFLALGAQPFLLAPALNVSIGQRLVRRICDKCKKEITLDEATLAQAQKLLADIPEKSEYKKDFNNLKFYAGAGCEYCQGIGYYGRIGIFEIMGIDDRIKDAMTKGNLSEYDIKNMAHENGVITMAQDGLLKALDGITSVEEVFRVAE